MQFLQPVPKHRAVLFLEDVGANLNHEIRPDTEDVSVERGVVNLAQSNTVWDDRMPVRMAIRENVRGLE